jgi:2-haloacid dehalogenase
MRNRSVAVFDLGGVLIDWNPRYLYRKLFRGDEDAMEYFLANVCTTNWNSQQDAGRSLSEACALLSVKYPQHSKMINAWRERYDEMLGGPIQGTVALLAELRSAGVPIYALSNWSAETFPAAWKRFDFLRWFKGILLSGHVRLLKPDPRIYRHFCEAHAVDPAEAIYIDDLKPNVEAAVAVGMHGIHFTDPPALRRELAAIGLLSEKSSS